MFTKDRSLSPEEIFFQNIIRKLNKSSSEPLDESSFNTWSIEEKDLQIKTVILYFQWKKDSTFHELLLKMYDSLMISTIVDYSKSESKLDLSRLMRLNHPSINERLINQALLDLKGNDRYREYAFLINTLSEQAVYKVTLQLNEFETQYQEGELEEERAKRSQLLYKSTKYFLEEFKEKLTPSDKDWILKRYIQVWRKTQCSMDIKDTEYASLYQNSNYKKDYYSHPYHLI